MIKTHINLKLKYSVMQMFLMFQFQEQQIVKAIPGEVQSESHSSGFLVERRKGECPDNCSGSE